MITIESLINAEFAGDNAEISSFLSKLEFISVVERSIHLVSDRLAQDDVLVLINHLGSSSLIVINEYIRKSKDEGANEHAEKVEIYMGVIFRQLLSRVVQNLDQNQLPFFLSSIHITLVDTCALFQYDYDELDRILGLSLSAKQNVARLTLAPIDLKQKQHGWPTYKWKGPKGSERFDQFVDVVEELGMFRSMSKFRELCSSPECNLNIAMTDIAPHKFLQYASFINSSTLLGYSNCDSFYQVLGVHVNGFEELVLKGNSPKRAVDNCRRRNDWEATEARLKKMFLPLVV